MHTDERREALQQLDHAWKHAAVGATEQAEQYVWRAVQLLDRAVGSQEGVGATMRREVAALAQRHHPVGPAPELLGLGVSGLEPAVLDKAQHQVAHQGFAMSRGAIELPARVKVTHR